MRQFTVFAVVVLSACFTKRVETMSQPTTLKLRVTCDVVVEQWDRTAFHPVAFENAIADVNVPAMGGGYSDRNGKISNVHDPEEYPVLRVRRGDQVLRELSIRGTAKLPKAEDGRALVPCE